MAIIEDANFTYDTETGKLFNRVTRHSHARIGCEAGYFRPDGYNQVRVNGVRRLLSHIIWDLLHPYDKIATGDEIDHIDHNPRNNTPNNLRKVTREENCRNYPKYRSNNSGVAGVYWSNYHSAWVSKIVIEGRTKHLYQGRDFFEACCRRVSALRLFNFHKNHGA